MPPDSLARDDDVVSRLQYAPALLARLRLTNAQATPVQVDKDEAREAKKRFRECERDSGVQIERRGGGEREGCVRREFDFEMEVARCRRVGLWANWHSDLRQETCQEFDSQIRPPRLVR